MYKFLVLAIYVSLVACDAGLCRSELIDELTSPAGKYIASVFERDCGATTPKIIVVSLRASNTIFDSEDDDNWVFTIHGESEVKALWISNEKLNITFTGTGDKPTQRTNWKDVAVSYNM